MSDASKRSFLPPWSPQQVASANAFQQSGVWHPFTCPNHDDGRHLTTGRHMDGADEGVLIAISSGWVCLSCDYSQTWTHDWMLNGGWRELFQREVWP